MEIKIDTKKDSSEDIKKMISFLQKFIEESDNYDNYNNYSSSSNNSSNDSNDDFNIPSTSMFDSPEPKKKDEEYTIIEY